MIKAIRGVIGFVVSAVGVFGAFALLIGFTLGKIYWLWMALKIGSWWMFAMFFFPLTWAVTMPVGLYSMVFGPPQWVVSTFGSQGARETMKRREPQSGVSARDEGGATPLMMAAALGQTEVLQELLKAGADIEARDKYGRTALMAAAVIGQTEAIRELLKAGADIEARNDDDSTALMMAVGFGQTEAIRELLKAGADVNAKEDKYGLTALMMAAGFGQTEAIRELLKAGANVNARDSVGDTAFDWWQSRQKDHPDFQEISDLLKP